jgi:DNA-3-methyladenine glycosylase I
MSAGARGSGRGARGLVRCPWAGDDPLYVAYHDEEWGVPLHDDRRLFELLVLEGFQAGLSWITILRKREAFRRAFRGFDPERVARFGARDVARLLGDAGIVRHRGKVEGAIASARAFGELVRAEGSFDRFVWSFVGGVPIVNRPPSLRDVPARTPASEALSRALRARGFAFVGPTTCYAFMQAGGLVDDHLAGCFRARAAPRGMARRARRVEGRT